MHNERWVNRFLYAWNDSLFYDAVDTHYEPTRDHFLSRLDERMRSRFTRSGIWWSHRRNAALPEQGWKIHVSATHRNVQDVAATCIDYLTEHDIDFKIALDLNIFEMLNSKAMARGSSGKFITIYPKDDDEFRACLSDLAHVLKDSEGAYVLSDMRYRDCKALYFRYGQILDTHTVDVMGRKVPYIMAPDGPVADDRPPTFVQPWWLPWPFNDWKPDDDVGAGDLLGGRFRVIDAIQFSNSGGVYQAEDTANGGQLVVLKEARPHTNVNPRRDYDAVDVLAREWTFLNRLADTGCFPSPIATFRQWEHHFIAEEHVDGVDIRTILFEHNPLVRPGFDSAQSRHFLRVFLSVSRGLARAVQAAHERQVILGDLTATNLVIHPDTFEVTVVDLESCRLYDSASDEDYLRGSIDLATPGFSRSRRHLSVSMPEDDLYGLATTMAYLIFPIAAMSYLRDDIFDLYRIYTDALGWPVQIKEILGDLAAARITLTDLLTFLDNEAELVDQVDVPPRQSIVDDQLPIAEVEAGVAAFVDSAADLGRETLFPVDPFADVTNPLSLGFGASGVLWALHASGVPVRHEWLQWLQDQAAAIAVEEYPAGLMSGLAGIAWAMEGLGLRTQARMLLDQANQKASDDYTFYYGLAGLGMTNLHFYLRHHVERDLAAAQECARTLLDTARRDGEHVFWLNDFATTGPLTGLGFGQAGVAMFLLRMYQVTRDESYLRLGRRALAWELANAEESDGDSVRFRDEGTLVSYVEVGSAGVAKVLLRYGDLEAARTVLRGVVADYSVLPGYAFGMSGVADAMLDAAAMTGDQSYRDTALRLLAYVRKVFLFEPAEWTTMPHRSDVAPLAVPGEGLLRCACDLMTGSAGVLRVLHRASSGGPADFLLDEVSR